MNNSAKITLDGTQIQIPLVGKKYSSGKDGHYAYKKVDTKKNKYTVQVMIIKVPNTKK